jgi:hypothetical protein
MEESDVRYLCLLGSPPVGGPLRLVEAMLGTRLEAYLGSIPWVKEQSREFMLCPKSDITVDMSDARGQSLTFEL